MPPPTGPPPPLLSAFPEPLNAGWGGGTATTDPFSRGAHMTAFTSMFVFFYDVAAPEMFLCKSGNLSQAQNRIVMLLPDLENVLVLLLMSAAAREQITAFHPPSSEIQQGSSRPWKMWESGGSFGKVGKFDRAPLQTSGICWLFNPKVGSSLQLQCFSFRPTQNTESVF